jgi:4'-phosphopantetheinyl transferase EntD
VAFDPTAADVADLHPAERAGLSAKAVPKRRAEFAAGRRAAHAALAALGQPPVALPVRTDRAPAWPNGLVGALTHTRGWALACAAPITAHGGLGLDLEHVEGVRRMAIAPKVADADELAWMGDDRRRLTALFSAKEAVFKALHPRYGAFFGFHAVTMRWRPDAEHFHTRLLQPLGPNYPAGATLAVTARWFGDYVLSATWLPPDGHPASA